MGRRGAPLLGFRSSSSSSSASALLLHLFYSMAVFFCLAVSASAADGSESLDLRTLKSEQRRDFLKPLDLEHIERRRRPGGVGTDDVKGRYSVPS